MATALASISLWLLDKIAGKGFEMLTDRLKSKELDQKFKLAIKNVSRRLEQKYPEILGNDIEFFSLKKMCSLNYLNYFLEFPSQILK